MPRTVPEKKPSGDRPAKHVLVLSSHGDTMTYIGAQDLLNGPLGSNRDSCEYMGRIDGTPAAHRALRSTDGIQFYHFRQKFPRTNTGQFTGPEHLEYWTDRLNAKLQKSHHKLDAIVIPNPDAPLSYDRLEPWLQSMRETWPELQILMQSPQVGAHEVYFNPPSMPLIDQLVPRADAAGSLRRLLPELPKTPPQFGRGV